MTIRARPLAAGLICGALLVAVRPLGAQASVRAGDLLDGAVTHRLDSLAIARSGARTLADLLAGRVPGFAVTYPTGAPGFAPELSARGAATVFGPGRPLLYIDGILLREDRHLLGPALDRQRPTQDWSLAVDEIAEVVVLPGPAAGALLGFGAPRGAVLVRTRGAGAGRPDTGTVGGDAAPRARWRTSGALEVTAQPAPPAPRDVVTLTGTTAGGRTDYCPFTDQVTGFCTVDGRRTFRPYGGRAPFRDALAMRAAVSGSGAVPGGRARLGATADQSPSALDRNEFERIELAGSFATHPWRGLTAASSLRYARTGGRYARWGEEGVLQLGAAALAPDDPDFPLDFRVADSLVARSLPYASDRIAATVALDWTTPGEGFGAHAQVAHDRLQRGSDLRATYYDTFGADTALGVERARHSFDQGSTAATLLLRGRRALAGGLAVGATLGGHLANADLQERRLESRIALDGSGSVSRRRLFPDLRSRALLAALRLDLGRQAFVGGGFRKEATELGDRAYGDDPFNVLQAGWTVTGSRLVPRIPGVSRLRLRAAYGESGDHESVLGAIVTVGGTPADFPARLQRTLEREAGIDLDLLGGAVVLRATAFDRALRDGQLANGAGAPAPPLLLGSWATTGTEWSLALAEREWGPVRWRLAAHVSGARTRVTRADSTVAVSTLVGGARVRFEEGGPFGAVFTTGYRATDVNGDGLIDVTEVTLTAPARAGVTQPTEVAGATLEVAWRGLRAGAVLDGRFGHVKYDGTGLFRCRVLVCAALYDSTASLARQARALASGYTNAFTGPVHPADAVRARELWVRGPLPAWLAGRAVRGATVTFVVRNVLLWTRYPAGDPETGSFAFATVQRGDWFTPALPRTYALRVDLAP